MGMKIHEYSLECQLSYSAASVFQNLRTVIENANEGACYPIRCVLHQGAEGKTTIEVGVLEPECGDDQTPRDIFNFNQRAWVNHDAFNVAHLVPTGIGAEVGGHAGDAGPAANLLAGCCDKLITHPNVGNASDINELADNCLYVEGSILCELLMGAVALQPVKANRILTLFEHHPSKKYEDATVNMVSAARAAAGIATTDAVFLDKSLLMRSEFSESGRATGYIEGFSEIQRILDAYRGQYDAVALATRIHVAPEFHYDYFQEEIEMEVNPWGGVEALLTHAVSLCNQLPSAHSPMMFSQNVQDIDYGQVDPRKAAEPVSVTYLFSVLKGLHRSPRVVNPVANHSVPGLISASDIHALVIPDGAIGLPTLAALHQGIPVIAVTGNGNCLKNDLRQLPWAKGQLIYATDYLQAAGILTALRQGICLESVQRPIQRTRVREANEVLNGSLIRKETNELHADISGSC